jgi:hypothetical protein
MITISSRFGVARNRTSVPVGWDPDLKRSGAAIASARIQLRRLAKYRQRQSSSVLVRRRTTPRYAVVSTTARTPDPTSRQSTRPSPSRRRLRRCSGGWEEGKNGKTG